MARKNSFGMYMLALLLLLAGTGYLVYAGFMENSVYFLNVAEALATPQEKLRSARLFGTVAREDLVLLEDGPGVRFLLEDKDDMHKTLPIMYRGAVPDTFKAGTEVIVEGGMATTGVFQASSLMTKCPSKYEKANRSPS